MNLAEIKLLIQTSYDTLFCGQGNIQAAIGTLEIALHFWDNLDKSKYEGRDLLELYKNKLNAEKES